MNIATVLAITLIIVGMLISFNAAWLFFSSVFPKFVRKSQASCAHPVKATLFGIGVAIVFVIAASQLGNALAGVVAWPLFLITSCLALAGTAALAQRIGSGMPAQNDRLEPWRRNLRGGIVLSLGYLLPFVGWIWIPVSLVFGAGVTTLTLLEIWKERKAAREAEEDEEEEGGDSENGETLAIAEASPNATPKLQEKAIS